jgi:hypothetical protein
VKIDSKPAEDTYQAEPIIEGEVITAEGELNAHGVLHAKTYSARETLTGALAA